MKTAKRKHSKRKKLLKWIGALAALCIVLLTINFVMNKSMSTTTYHITHAKINDSLDGFTIVQLSDLHSIRNERTGEYITKKVRKEEPHIIVITGDLIDYTYYTDLRDKHMQEEKGTQVLDEKTVEFVDELMEIAPVYYVFGNHERVFDNMDEPFLKALVDKGVIILNNKQTTITYNEQTINVVGISDPTTAFMEERFVGLGGGDNIMKAMLMGATETIDSNLYTVLLSHRPEYYEMYTQYAVDLVLTGHAHGGQIRIPFMGGLYAPNQGFFPEYTSGEFVNGSMSMIVSRGIGNSAFPLRVFNPPEIITIKLTAE